MKFPRKKYLLLLLVIIISGSARASSKTVKDTSLCLEITGKATCSGLQLSDVTVLLIQDNQEVEKVVLKDKGKFRFLLKKNSFYTIRLSKGGYVTRSISINTELPPGTKWGIWRFEAEVQLFRENPLMNNDYLDYPVAIISYHQAKDAFDYNKKYTAIIKQNIHKAEKPEMVNKD